MYCKRCGTKLKEGAIFCHKCGTKIVEEYVENPMSDKLKEENISLESDNMSKQAEENAEQPTENETSSDENDLEIVKWWNESSKEKRILFALGAVLVGCVVIYTLVVFLREFGYLLFGLLAIAGFILALVTGTKEEKLEARKTLVQLVGGGIALIVVAIIWVQKPELLTNIIQPGAVVRNAYLSEYSETVTVEDAFENYFAYGKWSVDKIDDYSYVLFDGTCEYLGEEAAVRLRFKITGEYFVVDSLDINGQTQNDFILYALLSEVYDNTEIQ